MLVLTLLLVGVATFLIGLIPSYASIGILAPILLFLSLFTIPLFSALSDRLGRRPVYLGAALFSAAWAFPFFILAGRRSELRR